MKLTDLAIISMVFFICMLVVIHVKGDILYNYTVNRVMYNKVMDNITEEALSIGYSGVDVDGYPVVELDKIGEYFKVTTDMYGGNPTNIMCYIDSDGFYMCVSLNGYLWNDKIYFTEKVDTPHEKKIQQLSERVNAEYGIDMNLPYNDGEKWENSVDEYSLIVISFEKSLEVYSFSGAKIHKK